MALPIKNFDGKLNNKNASDFITQLNFELKQDDRLKLIDETLYTERTEENKYLDKYFQIYFDEKFKYNPSKEDFLSSDNNVCRTLESMANYILFADDAEKIKKTEYNFYTVDQLKDKFGKDFSVDELIEKTYTDAKSEQALSYILDKSINFKKPLEQNITHKDIVEIKPIGDYEQYKMDLNRKLIHLRKTGTHKNLQRKIVRILKDVKSDQIYCKDKLKGTIYFKAPLQDSTSIDYDQFDNYNLEHVIALMGCSGSLLTDVGCLKYDLMQLINRVELDAREKAIVDYLVIGYNSLEIAKALKMRHNYIQFKMCSIGKKIIKAYESDLEDWYYTFKVKGKFKVCPQCKSIKILNKNNFGVDRSKKDSHKKYCKSCEKVKNKR
jgi:hypothetical protein